MLKRTFATVMTLVAMFCFTVVGETAQSNNWLIYWYVCGTDIESRRIAFGSGTDLMSNDPKSIRLAEPDRDPGDATRCINEVEKANLSPNVKIFMQAGGAYIWGHEKFRDLNAKIQTGLNKTNVIGNGNAFYAAWHLNSTNLKEGTLISAGKVGRYLYDKSHRNWIPREKLQISGVKDSETDMGSQVGLVSFLRAGQKLEQELYPDGNVRRVLIFVDHGGGIAGVCHDEYTGNIISLKEIQDSFKEVSDGWTKPDEKPFEVIAFDACIMSLYETAVAVKDVSNYMVASQESTKGKVMFGYTDLLNDLSKNPSMTGKEFGKVICNATWEDSKITDKEFNINSNGIFTESVIDLSEEKMKALQTAYTNFSKQALTLVQENPDDMVYTFAKFRNAANVSERFSFLGGTSPNMVDLKNFAENLSTTFPELKASGNELVKAINNSVVYNKRGSVYKRGGGLSIYYPLDLLNSGTDEYKYITTRDQLSPEEPRKLYDALYNGMQGKSVDLSSLKNKIIDIDEEKKTASIELSEEDMKKVESVRYQCLYLMPSNNNKQEIENIVLLGSDSEIEQDRQTGTFTISLKNKKCFTLNGQPLCVQIVSDATRKGKNGKKIGGNDICVSPILLNGENYKLFFSRQYPNGKITIIGAVPNIDGKVALPSSELKSFKKGDVVIPIYHYIKLGENQLFNMQGIPMTIGDNPKMEMTTIKNGIFGYAFEFVNPLGGNNAMTSEGVFCKIKNGNIVKIASDPEDL